jgi:uncharacterized protein (TIGR03435 family)
MTNQFGRSLSLRRKLMLTSLAVAAVTGPFAPGLDVARAQTEARSSKGAARDAPRFDVVSVKMVHSDMGGSADFYPVNGTWTAKALTIPNIIAIAYDVPYNRVEGVPKAVQGQDHGFTMVAKMPVKTSQKDFRLMLQSLLADRFKAVIHTEVRDIPVNTIELAKGGVKLRPASAQCVAAEGNAAVPAGQHPCHRIDVRPTALPDRTVTMEYTGWSVSMADLAAKLSSAQVMIDDTGLTGLYDLDVKIETHPGQDALETQTNSEFAWREAWEKQAGLLIDRQKTKKRPGTIAVVDHVELPTPN